ncbi:response regulator [Rhodohalobacter sp. SW132]|uniref:response regulator n=1 Tax=Rhodohalobacter sp. SW132 TaxID=2293433 RepID=UPI000E286E5C|nr:response regulator [Rhodohalobacter sp. SW132]REL24835.1 response regulator [Rhodohalobacter sp. SW132]
MKNVKGKIILVDDQKYEKDLLNHSLEENEWNIKVEYFTNARDALDHLQENVDEIFLIISDMNMPGMNGMEFKKAIDRDEYLRQKTIPFIFASSDPVRKDVIEAYQYRVQGFFKKPDSIEDQAAMLETIIMYWVSCIHPDKDDITAQRSK